MVGIPFCDVQVPPCEAATALLLRAQYQLAALGPTSTGPATAHAAGTSGAISPALAVKLWGGSDVPSDPFSAVATAVEALAALFPSVTDPAVTGHGTTTADVDATALGNARALRSLRALELLATVLGDLLDHHSADDDTAAAAAAAAAGPIVAAALPVLAALVGDGFDLSLRATLHPQRHLCALLPRLLTLYPAHDVIAPGALALAAAVAQSHVTHKLLLVLKGTDPSRPPHTTLRGRFTIPSPTLHFISHTPPVHPTNTYTHPPHPSHLTLTHVTTYYLTSPSHAPPVHPTNTCTTGVPVRARAALASGVFRSPLHVAAYQCLDLLTVHTHTCVPRQRTCTVNPSSLPILSFSSSSSGPILSFAQLTDAERAVAPLTVYPLPDDACLAACLALAALAEQQSKYTPRPSSLLSIDRACPLLPFLFSVMRDILPGISLFSASCTCQLSNGGRWVGRKRASPSPSSSKAPPPPPPPAPPAVRLRALP